MSQQDEIQPVSNVLSQIGLGYALDTKEDRHGNKFAFRGFGFVRTGVGRNLTKFREEQEARRVDIYDVLFKAVRGQ